MNTIEAREDFSLSITGVIEFLDSTGQLTRGEPSMPDGRTPGPDEGRRGQLLDSRDRDPREHDLFEGSLHASIEEFLSESGWDDLGAGLDTPVGSDDPNEEPEGFDFAAVYFPIHFYAEKWGIGIRTDSACRLAIRIAKEDGKWSRENRPSRQQRLDYLKAACTIYTLHETWHHQVEAAAIRLQLGPLLAGRPVYRDYAANVFRPTWGTDDCLEEALANAHMLRGLRKELKNLDLGDLAPASLRVARREVENSSPGYRRGVGFTSARAWNGGRSELLHRLVSGAISGYTPSLGRDLAKAVDSALTRDLHPTASPDNVRKTIRWIERGLWS